MISAYLTVVLTNCIGAGTILDFFMYKKPLITIVNESLKDNHQLEIFSKMRKEEYIQGCPKLEYFTVDYLRIMIQKIKDNKTKRFQFEETCH